MNMISQLSTHLYTPASSSQTLRLLNHRPTVWQINWNHTRTTENHTNLRPWKLLSACSMAIPDNDVWSAFSQQQLIFL